jgi:hypothetical protein
VQQDIVDQTGMTGPEHGGQDRHLAEFAKRQPDRRQDDRVAEIERERPVADPGQT